MAEENTSEVKDIENSSDTNPPKMSEEGSLETVRVKDVENVEDVIAVVAKDQEEIIPEIIEVPKPQGGTLRRHSTGTISKPQVQSRYRGNHRVGSTHDLCKHGKKCDQDDAVKPWKIARRKSVEGSVVIKVETPSSTRKSLGSVSRQSPGITKPDSSVSAKRDALAVQMTFKKGKVLDPKPEDSSPRWIKFKKRVVQELKTQSEGKKKNLKDRRLGVETKTDSCEGSKREKVVLRHRKVEGKKKMITLFNNVIEETVNKLTKVRKHKVKALIGAFETVISLQDTNKTSHKPQSKATTSASKVRPLVSEQ